MTTGAFRTADATVSAHGAIAVVKSDATVFPVCRALYVGTTGDVAVTMADGQTSLVFTAVANGVFPVQVVQVLSTGTSASNIVALY
jgi:hypothetical protein